MFLISRSVCVGAVLLAGFLESSVLFAGGMDDYIRKALEVHPKIASARKLLESKAAEFRKAGLLDDPMAGIEFEGFSTDSIDVGRFNDIEFSINQDFPFPGKRSLEKKSAHFDVSIAVWELEQTKRALVSEIKKAYLDFLMNDELIRLHRSHQAWMAQMVEVTKIQLRSGKVSQQDVLDAQVEKEKVHSEIFDLVRERRDALEMLKYLSHQNRPPQKIVPRSETLRDPRALIYEMDQFNPELKVLNAQILKKEKELALAGFEGRPKFTVKTEARQLEGQGLEEYDVMVGMSIPWLWGRTRAIESKGSAQAMLDDVRWQYQDRKNELKSQLRRSITHLRANIKIIRLFENDLIPLARSAVDAAMVKYRNSSESFFRVLDLQIKYLDLEVEKVREKYLYFQNRIELERIRGRDDIEWDSVGMLPEHEEVQNEK